MAYQYKVRQEKQLFYSKTSVKEKGNKWFLKEVEKQH